MGFSRTERLAARILSDLPFVKRMVKRTYQTLNYRIYGKSIPYTCSFPLTGIGDPSHESFFGYYDKSPVNGTGQFMIYHETSYPTSKKPDAGHRVNIVLYDLHSRNEVKRWPSSAYNWQQGSKLMWIDDRRFAYNDFDAVRQRYVARIVQAHDPGSIQIIDFPIYDASGDTALTLSFERLNSIMPDYGYRNHREETAYDIASDGICKIDFDHDNAERIITVERAIAIHRDKSMEKSRHWFNHIMLSPDGDHFIFLHRWMAHGRKYDALMLADINGKSLRCLADDGMVSHCCWVNNEEIISYMRDSERGNKYFKINIRSGERQVVGAGITDVFGDGHPSVYGNKMLFDTYPNRARMQELFLYDIEDQNIVKIGEFLSPLKYHGESRCDLHPRFSMDGRSVFIDSTHSGKRRLYRLDL